MENESPANRRLERRALKERWPMSATTRAKVLKRLAEIAGISPKRKDALTLADFFSAREQTAAIRALIAADRLNLDAAMFEHQTRPIEEVDDDYIIDLSAEEDRSLPPAP